MAVAILRVVLRGALLVAIVASTALFVDYRQGGPGFCGTVSGCAVVRASPYTHLYGVPLPVFGLIAFGGLYLLASWAKRQRHLKWLAAGCGLASLGAIALIALMVFEIGAVCQWCMAVDVGTITAALAAAGLAWTARSRPVVESQGHRLIWTALAVPAVALPLAWGQAPPYQPPPADVAELQQPGKINLVVFTDFACPFCRLLHPVVDELVAERPDELHVELVMVPMPMHPGADIAALAYLCVPPEKRREMANELFQVPYEETIRELAIRAAEAAGQDLETFAARLGEEPDLSVKLGEDFHALVTARCAKIATDLGVEQEAFGKCVEDEKTGEQLQHHVDMFIRAELGGTPATYVDNFLVQGADEPLLHTAVEAALAGSKGYDIRWMLGLLGGLFVFTVALTQLTRRCEDQLAEDKTSDEAPTPEEEPEDALASTEEPESEPPSSEKPAS